MNKNPNKLFLKINSLCPEVTNHDIFKDELTITTKAKDLLKLFSKLKDFNDLNFIINEVLNDYHNANKILTKIFNHFSNSHKDLEKNLKNYF